MAAKLLDRGGGAVGGDFAWVAPTYGVAERGVEAFRMIAPEYARIVGRTPARADALVGISGPKSGFQNNCLGDWKVFG